GGGLPNAEVNWRVTRSDARFTPPNRSAYTFGKANEFWWIDRRGKKEGGQGTWSGRASAAGEDRARGGLHAPEPPPPTNPPFEATGTDVNRQAWTARSDLLVHPAGAYVGLRQERAFVKAGEALGVDVIVTDLDGAALAGRAVTVKSARIDFELEKGEYVEVEA